MPYGAEINREQPGLFIFLVDQSKSMDDRWGLDPNKTLSQGTADVLNRLLHDLIIRSTKADGVRAYFDIAVIGYGGDVNSGFSTIALNELPTSLDKIANTRMEKRIQKVEDGTGGLVDVEVNIPVWLDPIANGPTPMCKALSFAGNMLETWVPNHQGSFPPILVNITDGKPTDGNPEPIAEKIRNLRTNDGNALLFNIHISSSRAAPVLYPSTEDLVPDEGKSLFRMSSVLPEVVIEQASGQNFSIDNSAKGFAFNADLVTLITFLDIGTRGVREKIAD